MRYDELVAFLDRTWTKASPTGTIDRYPFDEFRSLLAARGNPHLGLTTIHITGSKGKGSVTAMTAALLRQHGVPCVTFTSPHLNAIEERIQTGAGQSIDREELARRLTDLIAVSDRVGHDSRAIIRLLLVAALEHAHETGVQAAAIEVSMGGRFDPTNIIDGTIAAITAIGLEHVPRLGHTISEIAAQKVAIVKPGRTCVLAPQRHEAASVINAGIALAGGRVIQVHDSSSSVDQLVRYDNLALPADGTAQFQVRGFDTDGVVVDFTTPFHKFDRVHVALRGQHQAENAAVALNAAEQALSTLGVHLEQGAVRAAFACVKWPGRLELLRDNPPVLYDGAHTVESANVLATALRDHFPAQRWTFIVGMLTRRDVGAILEALAPMAREIIAVPIPGFDAIDPLEIAAHALPYGITVELSPSVAEALKRCGDRPTCVTGTLYLYAQTQRAVASSA